jgi:hypothetical protein
MTEKDVRKIALSVVRDYETVRKRKRTKPQFSKVMCVASWCLMSVSVFGNFILAYCGRATLSDMVMALISFVTVFVNGGYICQNIFRDTSLNKNGIHLRDGKKEIMLDPNKQQEETV